MTTTAKIEELQKSAGRFELDEQFADDDGIRPYAGSCL